MTLPDPRRWYGLIVDAHLATMRDDVASSYGSIEDGALAGRTAVCLCRCTQRIAGQPTRSCGYRAFRRGQLDHAGMVDCHTHLVFGGERAGEFEQRLQGASYEAIARAGGGIVASVRATRMASEDELLQASLPRARALRADGVTTIEIKSGYGLDTANELKMLRVARRIGIELGIEVCTTFLGAHALRQNCGMRRCLIDLVCNKCFRRSRRKPADAVDAYCEGRVPPIRRGACLKPLMHTDSREAHADQISDTEVPPWSAVRWAERRHSSRNGRRGGEARRGSVAVLLPGAFLCLREKRCADRCFRRHGVAMAVATDCNPHVATAVIAIGDEMACTVPDDARGNLARRHAAPGARTRTTRSRPARRGKTRRFRALASPRPAESATGWVGTCTRGVERRSPRRIARRA